MSSSPAQAQLGRQFWSSIRSTVDAFIWRLPPPPQRPVNSVFSSHLVTHRAPVWTFKRTFQSRAFPGSGPKTSPKNVRRSCTSGGLLLLGLSSPSQSTSTVVSSCTAAADTAISSNATQKSGLSRLAWQSWQRSIHTGRPGRGRALGRRRKSSKANAEGEEKKQAVTGASASQPKPNAQKAAPEAKPPAPGSEPLSEAESIANSMSKYLQSHLPKMPHRPTKEELLAAANGFWERVKVRFKWFSIRSMRPWNIDEWGAFVSWFMLGHIVWILVGTTTFFSLIIFTVNTVFAQEELAKWVGDYLTQSAGVTVVFESAIVPKWKDGVISFRNVFVSRRPGQVTSSVTKGSSSSAAALAAAKHTHDEMEEDDGNYTQFDLTINSVDVTLSFVKWWNGKGLLKDVEVKGVRGVVDRTSVVWSSEPVDPLSFRREHQPGDFEIERFKMEDLLVTIHQPGGFRPFPVSIYSCELPQLRKQWLFYDFLSANHMSGSFDGSLFTIHPRQVYGGTTTEDQGATPAGGNLGDHAAWKKFSRLRIDGLKIDHLNRGVAGPFGWIYEGNVDIVADVMFPAEEDDGIGKVMSDFYERMEEAVTSNRYLRIMTPREDEATVQIDNTIGRGMPLEGHLPRDTEQDAALESSAEPNPPALSLPGAPDTAKAGKPEEKMPRYLVMDLRLHLNDVRAAVPFFPQSDSLGSTMTQSYINAALIRPIVAYINAKRTYIPISCRIVKRVSDFDGAWTVFDCGLMDDCSAEVYAAFARDVEDQQSRVRRLKKVGFWTLSMVVHALLAGVAGAGDYM